MNEYLVSMNRKESMFKQKGIEVKLNRVKYIVEQIQKFSA